MNWWKSLKGKISLAEPLKEHTTFKIGGTAKFFIEPKDLNDLKLLIKLAKRYKIPIFVLGRGSNILISDKGLDSVVIRLNAPFFKRLIIRGNCLKANSGALLNEVILFAHAHGLSGLEFLVGIPGTVGGALVMNAGVNSNEQGIRSISDLVETVTVMDYNGNTKTLNKKDIKFGYRKSNLSKYIILSTCIRLSNKNKKEIDSRIKRYISYRIATQDLSRPSAGCVFKNPAGYSAGRLIDLCGFKGKRIGNACVSERHANFILNAGQARSKDVLELMDLIRERVKARFNIILEPEIKIWR